MSLTDRCHFSWQACQLDDFTGNCYCKTIATTSEIIKLEDLLRNKRLRCESFLINRENGACIAKAILSANKT